MPTTASPSSTWPTGCGQPAGRYLPTHCPKNRQDLAIQRILVRHDFSRDLADLLLDDYKRALRHFDKHPVASSLTEAEASGFNHN